MKIGILTTYFADYGSFAHASALYNTLSKLGHDVEIINECLRYKYSYRLYAGYLMKKYLPEKVTKRIAKYNPMLSNYFCLAKELETYKISEQFLDMKDIIEKYDLIVIGSDELWSITNNNIRYVPEYFGSDYSDKIRVITYGTSGITLKNVKDALNDDIIKSMRSIETMLVRDYVTENWVKKYIRKDVRVVLDPALLNPYYLNNTYLDTGIDSKYMLIYGEFFCQSQINEIIKYSIINNYEIVSVVWRHSWANRHYEVDSLSKLMAFIDNAEYVVTSTFHGVIFSIVNHKQFTAYIEQLRGVKVVALLKQLDIEETIDSFSFEIDYELLEKKLEELRKESITLLKDAIIGE